MMASGSFLGALLRLHNPLEEAVQEQAGEFTAPEELQDPRELCLFWGRRFSSQTNCNQFLALQEHKGDSLGV